MAYNNNPGSQTILHVIFVTASTDNTLLSIILHKKSSQRHSLIANYYTLVLIQNSFLLWFLAF